MILAGQILESRHAVGIQPLRPLDFDLRETVESTIELLAARATAKGLELNAFIPYQLPSLVRGDGGRLRQVLMNLTARFQLNLFLNTVSCLNQVIITALLISVKPSNMKASTRKSLLQ